MSSSLPFLTTRTVSVPVEFFTGFRQAIRQSADPVPVEVVRDAGYAAGRALYEHFATWLADRGEHGPNELPDERFPGLVAEFFVATGWGTLTLTSISDAVMAVDASNWSEATGTETPGNGNGCHISTGMFAGFFGRLADAPISVLEVECEASGDPHCRFLLGSVDVLGYVHEAMDRGIPYERAAASA